MIKKLYVIIAIMFIGNVNAQVAETGATYKVDWADKNYSLEHEDITYKTIDGLELKLDILAHKELDGSAPTVVYVHGGDWNKGNKSYIHRPLVEDLFQRIINLGYRVVSINYRLCRPETPVIYAISDAKDAVRWVKKNADKYDFDANKVVMMGTSAGAHISMMAAYSSDERYMGDNSLKEYSSQAKGVINCYGPVEVLRTFHYKHGVTIQLGRWLFNKSLYQQFTETSYDFSGYKYPTKKKEIRSFMRAQSVNEIANPRYTPTLTLHGGADKIVTFAHAKELKKYLDSYSIPKNKVKLKKVKHSFVRSTTKDVQSYCNAAETFLNQIY